MRRELEALLAFHRAMNVYVAEQPTAQLPEGVAAVRLALLEEELQEYREALAAGDLVAIADALTDLLYVLLGTFVSHGLQDVAEALFDEVHRSNMTKRGPDGQVIYREDGKVLKPPTYEPPDLRRVLEEASRHPQTAEDDPDRERYTPLRVLAFAGSTRRGSLNFRLAQAAAREAEALGAEVHLACLSDYPLPVYDADREASQGLPEAARAFKALLAAHDVWLIASPEYNGFFTPLLKNALDWATRREAGEPRLAAFQDKVAAIMSATPGALGGIRGLPMLRLLLNNLGVLVIPEQLAVGHADEVLGKEGALRDEHLARRLRRLVQRALRTAQGLRLVG